jgi:hypothetical protein
MCYAQMNTLALPARAFLSHTMQLFSDDLGNHLSQSAQTGHSERSSAAFSSSFAPANEPRCAVEESLFD